MTSAYRDLSTLSSSSSMRGWIMRKSLLEWCQKRRALLDGSPAHGSRRRQLAAHDSLQLGDGAIEVVVDDDVVELPGELELLARDRESLLDLSPALGGAGAQPALELGERRRPHEDRDPARNLLLDCQRPVRLEVEQRHPALAVNALDLAAQRADALAPRVVHVLDEGSLLHELRELPVRDEPVLAAVALARAPLAG